MTSAHDDLIAELNARDDVRSRFGELSTNVLPPADIRVVEVSGKSAGIVGIVPSSGFDPGDLELICAISETHEGRGIATAACASFLKAFTRPELPSRVFATVAADNPAGQRLVAKLGFVRIAVPPKSCDGHRNAEVSYELQRSVAE